LGDVKMELQNILMFFFLIWGIPIIVLLIIISPFLLFAFIVKKFKIKRFMVTDNVKDFSQFQRRVKDVVEEEIKRKSLKS